MKFTLKQPQLYNKKIFFNYYFVCHGLAMVQGMARRALSEVCWFYICY